MASRLEVWMHLRVRIVGHNEVEGFSGGGTQTCLGSAMVAHRLVDVVRAS